MVHYDQIMYEPDLLNRRSWDAGVKTMQARDLINDLKDQVAQLEFHGENAVSIIGLKKYLDLAEKNSNSSNEFRKMEHEGMLADYAASTQWGTELFKAVLESGKSALHSLLIINGGAVIALMGVMSSLVGKPDGQILAGFLALPLLLFGLGVLSGGLGFAFRYFSQACYTADFQTDEPWHELVGNAFRWLAVLSALSGYALFTVAIFGSYHAFSSAFSP